MNGEGRRGVAIVTAMGIESAGLSRALEAGPWARRRRRGWQEGLLGDCPVVLATCGVGQKAARRWAQVLLEEYEPRAVILTGASGGVEPYVEVGDLVLGECVYQLDGRGVAARHPADAGLLAMAHQSADACSLRPVRRRQPRIVEAGVATADGVVTNRRWGDQLARDHGIVAVEMEGAAIAIACHEAGVPFLAVRAVSDIIGRPWQLFTAIRYLVPAQRNAERVIFALVQSLNERD